MGLSTISPHRGLRTKVVVVKFVCVAKESISSLKKIVGLSMDKVSLVSGSLVVV